MKKIIVVFLVLLAVSLAIGCAAADSYGPESFGPGGTLKWAINGMTMKISGTGAIPDYDPADPENTAPWRTNQHAAICDGVTRIVIEDGVTGIGSEAFYNLTKVTEVKIADSVTAIGSLPFYPTYLQKLVLPDNITSFDAWSEYSLYVNPDSKTARTLAGRYEYFYTKDGAYFLDASYGSILVESVDSDIVKGEVTIPRGITQITPDGNYSRFSNTMTEIVFPDTLKTIDTRAFRYLPALRKITFSSAVTVGANAFQDCTNLETIVLTGEAIANAVFKENAFGTSKSLKIEVDPSVKALPESLLTNADTKNATFYVHVGPVYDQLKNAGKTTRFLSFVPTGIYLRNSYMSTSLYQGRTLELSGIYTNPTFNENVEDPALKPVLVYASLDENIATVDQNGVIYGVAPGQARITVSVKDHPEVKLTTSDGAYLLVTVNEIPDGALKAFVSGTCNGSTLTATFGAAFGKAPYTFRVEASENGSVIKSGTYTTEEGGQKLTFSVAVKEDQATAASKTIWVTATDADGKTSSASLTYTYSKKQKYVEEPTGRRIATNVNGRIVYTAETVTRLTYVWERNISGSSTSAGGILSITLDKKELKMKPGESAKLTASASGGNSSDLAWYSSDPSVAAVDVQGNVTALKEGTAVITCKSIDTGHAAATCPVYCVETFAESIAVTKGAETDKTLQLNAAVSPANASIRKVTWTSSDPELAPIDENGLVTWKDNLKATFTATAVDGSGKAGTIEVSWTAYPKKLTGTYELYQIVDKTVGILDRNQAWGLMGLDILLKTYDNQTVDVEIWLDGEYTLFDHVPVTTDGSTLTAASLGGVYFKFGSDSVVTSLLSRGVTTLVPLGKAPKRIDVPEVIGAWKMDRADKDGTILYLADLQQDDPTFDEHFRFYNNGLVWTKINGNESTIPYTAVDDSFNLGGLTYTKCGQDELCTTVSGNGIDVYYIPEDRAYSSFAAAPAVPLFSVNGSPKEKTVTFTVPERGFIDLSISNKTYVSFLSKYGYYDVRITSGGREVMTINTSRYCSEKTEHYFIGLDKGDYSITFVPKIYSSQDSVTDMFRCAFTADAHWEVESNNTMAKATALAPETVYTACFGEEEDDNEYFSFQAVAGNRYHIRFMDFDTMDASTAIVSLLSSNGTNMNIRMSQNAEGFFLDFTPDVSGTYYVYIYNYSGYQYGIIRYQLGVFAANGTSGKPEDSGKDERLPGDVNKDGEVDGRDAVHLMKYLAGEDDLEIDLKNADVTGDNLVDEMDVLRLIRYFAGDNVILQ